MHMPTTIVPMANPTTDARWPKLLSLAVHEFRTPLTVVAGYIRMLLKERAGPVPDAQRRLLEEAEKSCTRLSALLAEISELSALEGGTATFTRTRLDVRALLEEVTGGLPALPERTVEVVVAGDGAPLPVTGDSTRLRAALSAIATALRRELVTSDQLIVHAQARPQDGHRHIRIAIAEPSRVRRLVEAGAGDLATFDEWRGGVGLSLANARRVIEAHGGLIWSPQEESKAAAIIELPAD
jgi:signal transduction histidine kinase